MSNYPLDAWRRLGGLLRSRRAHIDPSYRNRGAFCDATGLNYKLVQEIEGAARTSFTDESLAVLERGYRLVEGSIRHTLAGGPLEPLGEMSAAEQPSGPPPPGDLEGYVGQTPMEKVLLEWLRSDRRARQDLAELMERQARALNDIKDKVDRLSPPDQEDPGQADERQIGA